MTRNPWFTLPLVVLILFLTACGTAQTEAIANAVPTQMSESVATAIAAVSGPTHPNLPEYPVGSGVAPAGIYQAPTFAEPVQWYPMPDYPDNTTMVNPWGENPANCGTQDEWEFCSYAFWYQISIIGPNSMVGMTVRPSNVDGYMLVDGVTNGETVISTYESQTLAISDGTTTFIVRMTAQWPVNIENFEITTDAFTYEIGYLP